MKEYFMLFLEMRKSECDRKDAAECLCISKMQELPHYSSTIAFCIKTNNYYGLCSWQQEEQNIFI